MIDRKTAKRYIFLHIGIVGALSLFPVYWWVTSRISATIAAGGCFLHDLFHLYCAFCGGTRCLGALLRLDLGAAFAYNALIPILILFALVVDAVALIRLLRGRSRLVTVPAWTWVALCVLLLGYVILRNYLMIARGYDPVGDLGIFWNR